MKILGKLKFGNLKIICDPCATIFEADESDYLVYGSTRDEWKSALLFKYHVEKDAWFALVRCPSCGSHNRKFLGYKDEQL